MKNALPPPPPNRRSVSALAAARDVVERVDRLRPPTHAPERREDARRVVPVDALVDEAPVDDVVDARRDFAHSPVSVRDPPPAQRLPALGPAVRRVVRHVLVVADAARLEGGKAFLRSARPVERRPFRPFLRGGRRARASIPPARPCASWELALSDASAARAATTSTMSSLRRIRDRMRGAESPSTGALLMRRRNGTPSFFAMRRWCDRDAIPLFVGRAGGGGDSGGGRCLPGTTSEIRHSVLSFRGGPGGGAAGGLCAEGLEARLRKISGAGGSGGGTKSRVCFDVPGVRSARDNLGPGAEEDSAKIWQL